MGYGRNGRKSSEIPAKELEDIRRRERNGRKNRKARDAKQTALAVKESVEEFIGRNLTSQEIEGIESDERRLAFLQYYFQYDCNIAAACTCTGITRGTFNRWMNKYPEFAEHITEVNEAMLDLAEQQLMENIKNGKEQSLFFFLCNKGKHRGWQDIRKLNAPKLNAININIKYADKKEKPHGFINVTPIEAETTDDTENENTD